MIVAGPGHASAVFRLRPITVLGDVTEDDLLVDAELVQVHEAGLDLVAGRPWMAFPLRRCTANIIVYELILGRVGRPVLLYEAAHLHVDDVSVKIDHRAAR